MKGEWTAHNDYRVDLPELLSQGEQNYARLMALLHPLQHQDQLQLQIGTAGTQVLRIEVLERARYTTEIRLRQEGVHRLLPGPVLIVRLYHDARLAEVTEVTPFRRVAARQSYPNPHMHQPDEKRQWNRFLSDWLRHVRDHGHLAAAPNCDPLHVRP